ncbi:MAG: methyltransferase domain-containing protein [Parcubacteria group bacterium]|nr:methyltransferase domain-containing protein [Parcubacteria group bacterium]
MTSTDEKVNKEELTRRVKAMYSDVAQNPAGEYHFEMSRGLAEKLGYPKEGLDKIPPEALESFAGVGYHFGLADLKEGESIFDVGSGSGTDVFFAANKVGKTGRVVGIDMTDEQLKKSEGIRSSCGFENVSFVKGYIENIPVADASFDVVISNGVINLSAEKGKVFAEIARILKPGGRLAISDIVTSKALSERKKADAELWAACIGGAIPEWEYMNLIERAGMRILETVENQQYRFTTHEDVMAKYGVKSKSILAQKTQIF